jgi:hypothetical protein
MQDVHISQLATDITTAYTMKRPDAETLARYAITAVGANLPAGAVAVTEGVYTDAYDYVIAGEIDPAAAVEMVMDRVTPDEHDDLSPAKLRDYCRRAAYDMFAAARKVTADQVPAIADEVARRIGDEAAWYGQAVEGDTTPPWSAENRMPAKADAAPAYTPAGRPGHVAGMDVLAALPGSSWVMEYNGRDFHGPAGAFTMTKDDETVTINLSRPVPSAVEIFHLDRPTTTAARVARIITAALEADEPAPAAKAAEPYPFQYLITDPEAEAGK